MSTLIIVEHDNVSMQPSTRQVVAASLAFSEKPVLLVVGYQCRQVADKCARLAGVGSVWLVDNEVYAHPLAENLSELIKHLASSFTTILAASSTFGKNILPRVAALLNVTQVSDVTHIVDEQTFEHPIYAGNAIELVRVLDKIKVLTIRTTAFDAVKESDAPCSVELIDKKYEAANTHFVNHELNESTRPDLSSAKIVVSGGRGMQSAEQFKLIDKLADTLGAAVGASRAAVDAGFVPNDYQVGQTGKVVAPNLYIAVGISGAVQHLAGMKDSKVIVAINKDSDAPIFQIADYGLVGDLFVLIPALIDCLNKNKKE